MAHFTFEGHQVYYESYGSGKPLVLLNGIMMSCASWKEFVGPLSTWNRLIMVDFLDQGKSDQMTEPYDHAVQVRLVDALLAHLELSCAVLAGISYGSEIALEYALAHPDKVERLVLLNATAATGPWLRDIGKAWNLAAADSMQYYYTAIPIIYSPGFYTRENGWMEQRRELLQPVFSDSAFIQAMIRLTNSSENYDVRDRLNEITCPTLVVSCQQDYLVPLEQQLELVRCIPCSHHVILPNCGHASMYEQPLLFSSLLLGFTNLSKLEYPIK